MLIVTISAIELVIWQEGGSQVGVTGNEREGVWEEEHHKVTNQSDINC